MPRSREHEERPAAGRARNVEGPKKHIYIPDMYIYIVPKTIRFSADTIITIDDDDGKNVYVCTVFTMYAVILSVTK